MPTRQTNTMGEFYSKMLKTIAEAKGQPDADLQALVEIETGILERIHAPDATGAAQAQSGGAAPPPGPQGPMPGMPGPTPVMAGAPPGTPAGGGMAPPGMGMMTNPDELRRMLQQ